MNIFEAQRKFMVACDQTVDHFNQDQFNLYVNLIKEEFTELQEAIEENDRVEMLDALIDILVVATGALHSMGADSEGAATEVFRSNFTKVDSTTGKVIKRADGKVLKPETYSPPELAPYVTKNSQ